VAESKLLRSLYSIDFLSRPAPPVPERREQARPLDRGKEGSGTVNAYEIMLLLDSELPEERQNEILARARELIEKSGGSWVGHDPWGRRKLAYEIDHKGEAYYHVFQFDADPATLEEITRVLKITDGAVRHMAVRRPVPRARKEAVPASG
jgi:small subunit ribosomal protein S6